MIPPRGCAYVVMDRRQDGYKALQRLKNVKLQGSNIKVRFIPVIPDFVHVKSKEESMH